MEQSLTDYCGACGAQEEGDNNYRNTMLVCNNCEVKAHVTCTDGYGTLLENGTWQCALCSSQKSTQCCLCLTKSSQLLRRPTYPNCLSWVHSVCLHGNFEVLSEEEVDARERRKEQMDRDHSDDSDDDEDDHEEEDDDDYGKCVICVDDDSNELQKVRCSKEGCETVFHMSCAWLKGYRMEKVDFPISRVYCEKNLMIPIEYRIKTYCIDHSESESIMQREKVDNTVRDLMVVENIMKKDAYKKKPSTSSQSSSSKAEESGNESDRSGDSFLDYFREVEVSKIKKKSINEKKSEPRHNIGGSPRSGKVHNTSSKSVLPTTKINTIAPPPPKTITVNKNLSDTPKVLKSTSDLKNPNAQEEYKILRQKRIAKRRDESEEEMILPLRIKEDLEAITASPSIPSADSPTNDDTATYDSATSSSIEAKEPQTKTSSQKHPNRVNMQPMQSLTSTTLDIKARESRVSSVQELDTFYLKKDIVDENLKKDKGKERPSETSVHSTNETKTEKKGKKGDGDERSDDSVILSEKRFQSSGTMIKKSNDTKERSRSKEYHSLDKKHKEERPYSTKSNPEYLSNTEKYQLTERSIGSLQYQKGSKNIENGMRNERGNGDITESNFGHRNSNSQNQEHISTIIDIESGKRKDRSELISRDRFNEYRSEARNRQSTLQHREVREAFADYNGDYNKSDFDDNYQSRDQSRNRKSTQSLHPLSHQHIPIKSNNNAATCRYYNTKSGCYDGDKCRFSHIVEDSTPFQYGTSCRYYSTNLGCYSGDKCPFSHSTKEDFPSKRSKKD